MSCQQRIFNRIWNHFIVRGAPISHGDDFLSAMYYSPGEAKCSIGIFIPEDIYKPAMEGNDVETLLARWPLFTASLMQRGYLPIDTDSEEFWSAIQFLIDMQEWHDDANDNGETYVDDFDNLARKHLISIAQRWNLCCPTL